jgi:predicted acylesterase/phospholipase RssA
MMNTEKKPTIHIGICLAGAVSAGAYLAGAMDMLVETLDKWEAIKKENPEKITHNVVIDVIGGASGGGITAVLFALELFGKLKYQKTGNDYQSIFHKTWVDMFLNGQKEPYEALLNNSDIAIKDDKAPAIKSLLNSEFIDKLMEHVKDEFEQADLSNLPSYVSKDLAVVLTVTNLSGFPVKVKMDSGNKERSHNMFLHKDAIRFKIKNENAEALTDESFIALDLSGKDESLQTFLDATRATSAFPLGFKPRRITRKKSHIAAQLEGEFDNKGIFRFENEDEDVATLNVDGGAMNNEPFDDIDKILENILDKSVNKEDQKVILMIDPFPSEQKKEHKDKEARKEHLNLDLDLESMMKFENKAGVLEYASAILGALRRQSMFKTQTVLNSRIPTDKERVFMIIPSLSKENYNDFSTTEYKKEALATSALEAFGGLLALPFRTHDYELGKHNLDSFLTKYFSDKNNEKIVDIGKEKKDIVPEPSFEEIYLTLEKIKPIKDLLALRIDAVLKNYVQAIQSEKVSKEAKSKKTKTKQEEMIVGFLQILDPKKKSIGESIITWILTLGFVKKAIMDAAKKLILSKLTKIIVTDLVERGLLRENNEQHQRSK